MTVAEMIRSKREDADLTQAELAEISGVPIGTLFNWESGRCAVSDASSNGATRVALALRIPPAAMFAN